MCSSTVDCDSNLGFRFSRNTRIHAFDYIHDNFGGGLYDRFALINVIDE